MEMLRIKCPSCGIVLEVRNSKDESVKRIVCPNCKKRLAVTFKDSNDSKPVSSVAALYEGQVCYHLHEGINPVPHIASGLLELRVLSLKTGEWKYILRALTNEQSVLINGQILYKDDEVALLRGDEIEVDGVILTFDKPGREPVKSNQDLRPLSALLEENKDKPVVNKDNKGGNKWIFLLVIAVLFAIMAIFWFVSSANNSESSKLSQTDAISTTRDTIKPATQTRLSDKPSKAISKKAKDNVRPSAKENLPASDDFTLEMRATKGDVNAQYQIGMRWVTSNDCSDVVKGVKYLESAARNGYAQAQYALGVIYHKGSPTCGIYRNIDLSRQYMQQASRNGNAKAKKFLELNYGE